jgi:hypothetical protein
MMEAIRILDLPQLLKMTGRIAYALIATGRHSMKGGRAL